MSAIWIEVGLESHFPIQNLPLGVGRIQGRRPSLLVRLGEFVFDCEALRIAGLLGGSFPHPLLDLTCLDVVEARALRQRFRELLQFDNPELRDNALRDQVVAPVVKVEMCLPCRIGAYVDFYSGIHHAGNVGRMFRPEMPPLLPNYRHLPVAYNGRASTVVISGSKVSRPKGQFKPETADSPVFALTEELDFELEMGFFLGAGNCRGTPIPIEDAEKHMHGLVLVNDWSARDIQRLEYQPLGPFLAKSFATSISPWVVPLDALDPFRVPCLQEPQPLTHLQDPKPSLFDLNLDVLLQTPGMARPQTISRSNSKHLYWSFAQQLAHQTSNGTQVEPGDLYSSGTISGPDPGTYGSLLELTWRGEKPIKLHETGERRTYLEDGDIVTLTGYAQGDGYRIGFGDLVGQIE